MKSYMMVRSLFPERSDWADLWNLAWMLPGDIFTYATFVTIAYLFGSFDFGKGQTCVTSRRNQHGLHLQPLPCCMWCTAIMAISTSYKLCRWNCSRFMACRVNGDFLYGMHSVFDYFFCVKLAGNLLLGLMLHDETSLTGLSKLRTGQGFLAELCLWALKMKNSRN